MATLTLGPARISWPGVRGVESFAYTCSHGASPGTAVLVTLPRSNAEPPPAAFGDLVWGDGRRAVRLRDCKLDGLAPRVDSSGYSWVLTIFDRRWRWRTPDASFGRISGSYNERDAQKKLVPSTIRSPEELAKLCLKAMGETRYEIALPKGLTRADGAKYADK
ncbi:hypothetical protein J0H58_19090, partial [bacterium]|nr:hypothetical protein [bacterium]